jgi:hypothetical protein
VGAYRLRLKPPDGRREDSFLETNGSFDPKGYTCHEVTAQASVGISASLLIFY